MFIYIYRCVCVCSSGSYTFFIYHYLSLYTKSFNHKWINLSYNVHEDLREHIPKMETLENKTVL